MALASFHYKLIAFLVTPIVYLGAMAYFNNFELTLSIIFRIMVYSCLLMVDLWMDYYLFHGITGKRQMEILKSAYHGLNILNDGLLIDKIRRFLELFLLTVFSQYTGMIQREIIQIPILIFYLLETVVIYCLLEIMVFFARKSTGFIVSFFICMVTMLLCIIIQISMISIVSFDLEYIVLIIFIVVATVVSVFTHKYMMNKIYDGKYDERREK